MKMLLNILMRLPIF